MSILQSLHLGIFLSLSSVLLAETVDSTAAARRSAEFTGLMFELIPSGAGADAAVKQEIPALGEVAKALKARSSAVDVSAIEKYIQRKPETPHKPALLLNAGMILYQEGSYSRALDAFEQSWEAIGNGPDGNDPQRRLASKIGVELGGLYARLGRKDELAALMPELKRLPVEGKEAIGLDALDQALFLMKNHPETSFKCGPLAMLNLWNETHPGNPIPRALEGARSTPSGFSLEELETLGSKAGFPLRAIKSAKIPVPSVVHWKSGHYAAILSRSGDEYHVKDPTFLTDFRMSREAIAEEASGYFLVPERVETRDAKLPNFDEKRGVRGRGAPSSQDISNQSDGSSSRKCPEGMPAATYNDFYVSLVIQDTPMLFRSSVGPDTRVDVTYNQVANADHVNGFYGNIGKRWFLSWNRYIEDTAPSSSWTYGSTCKLIRENGNIETLTVPSGSSGTASANSLFSRGSLVRQGTQGAQSFRRNLSDGSIEIYARKAAYPSSYLGPKPARYFLTEQIDPQGNKLTFHYDDNSVAFVGNRLREVRDANGLVTKVEYADAAQPYLISSITDSFGRSARFEYVTMERLGKITDAVSIESSFAYSDTGQTDFVNSMTTPYGTSQFTRTSSSSTGVWLSLTDPEGLQEKLHFRYSFNGLNLAGVVGTSAAAAETPVASGIEIANATPYYGYLYYGVTLHWDQKTMRHFAPDASGLNFDKAHQTRWSQVTTSYSSLTGVPSSRRPALSHREWFRYAGQPNAGTVGTSNLPTIRIRRIKDENGAYANEIWRQEYNPLGNPTKSTDPLSREILLEYEPTRQPIALAVPTYLGN